VIKREKFQSFSVLATVSITTKDRKLTTYSSFTDGRDQRPSDYTTTLQSSLLHDPNASLDSFWPFHHHAFTLLSLYLHKLGRPSVLLRSQSATTTTRRSTRRTISQYHVQVKHRYNTLPDRLVVRRSNSLMMSYASVNPNLATKYIRTMQKMSSFTTQ
jgi:hypothetical protein